MLHAGLGEWVSGAVGQRGSGLGDMCAIYNSEIEFFLAGDSSPYGDRSMFRAQGKLMLGLCTSPAP